MQKKKDTTYRINDNKNIMVGDELSLCSSNGKEFGKALAVLVKETIFENLTEEDKAGHGKSSPKEELYKTFSDYYKMEVSGKTKVKIIKFKLL
ncbi:ASCH domain-containing protein [Candidatus Woesearchaeota archaeon]|nr:ASCH domain-containing protein [Candidatus Woesearchaeota archaeon]